MERDRLLALEKERAKEEAKQRLVTNLGICVSVVLMIEEGSSYVVNFSPVRGVENSAQLR